MNRIRSLLSDDTGSAMVVSFLFMLTLTGGAVLWLSRDVDRAVASAAEADSVAFQSARAAAQAIDPASLRAATPAIDPAAARDRAAATAAALFGGNGTVGQVIDVEVSPAGDRVTVVVEITEAGRTVTGQATARLAVGVSNEGDT